MSVPRAFIRKYLVYEFGIKAYLPFLQIHILDQIWFLLDLAIFKIWYITEKVNVFYTEFQKLLKEFYESHELISGKEDSGFWFLSL